MNLDPHAPPFSTVDSSSMEAIWNQVDAYQKWLGTPYRDNELLIAEEAAEPSLLPGYDGVGKEPLPSDQESHPIPPPMPVNEDDKTSSAQ